MEKCVLNAFISSMIVYFPFLLIFIFICMLDVPISVSPLKIKCIQLNSAQKATASHSNFNKKPNTTRIQSHTNIVCVFQFLSVVVGLTDNIPIVSSENRFSSLFLSLSLSLPFVFSSFYSFFSLLVTMNSECMTSMKAIHSKRMANILN